MSSSATACLVLLLAAHLIALSCGDQSVCTVTDEDSRPLCDGDVFHVYPPVTDESTSLYFAFMQSFSGGYISSGGIPGVMVALDEINANSSVLPGYTLHYALSDNACVRYLSQRTLFKQLREDRMKVAAVGSGCSLATEPAAEISHFFNMPQISCHSSSPLLRGRERFRNYFQTIGSEENQGLADFGVIQYYGWRRVTILQQDVDIFEKVTIELRDRLRAIDVSVEVKTFEEDEGIDGLGNDPFGSDRIFAFIMYEEFARDLLCEAFNRGLKYPRFTFLHAAWWSDQWWRGKVTKGHNCTIEERETVVEYSLAVLLYEYIEDNDDVAETGLNGHTFRMRFAEHHETFQPVRLAVENPFGQSCYDAIWILALALDRTIDDLSTMNPGFDIRQLSYDNNTQYLETLTYHLNKTDFLGISGRIRFDEEGIRDGGRLFMYQNRYRNGQLLQGNQMQPVARIDGNFNFEYVGNNSNETVWPDGIPHDGIPVEEIVTVHISVTVLCVLLASAGVVFTVACLLFNFVFRNKKLIRLTSPNLNYIIGAGAVLLYLDVCLIVTPSTDRDVVKVLCNVTPWLTSLGYSLCFGTIIGKMARVFYIFINPTFNKKLKIQDYHLALFVGVLVIVDVLILLIYTVHEGIRGNLDPTKTINVENPSDIRGVREIETENFFYTCSSRARNITLGVLYGYKTIIQAATVIMALRTRKVKVRGVDDYREIILATYLSSFLIIIILIFTYTIDDHINTFAALSSLSLMIGTTMIVVLVFVPKMISLYKDPEGKKVFSMTAPSDHNDDYVRSSTSGDVENLRLRVLELEMRLSQVQVTEGTLERRQPLSRVTFIDTFHGNQSHVNGSLADLDIISPPANESYSL